MHCEQEFKDFLEILGMPVFIMNYIMMQSDKDGVNDGKLKKACNLVIHNRKTGSQIYPYL